MIRVVDIELNAENPGLPLCPFVAYVGSPMSVRILKVPRKIGTWEITKVFISANFPDNSIQSRECVLVGAAYVGTIPGCAVPGKGMKGFAITADGVDERGNAVTGYVLGVGDVMILDRDGTVTVGETTYYFHVFEGDEPPTTPKKYDVAKIDGVLKYYDGTAWQPFAKSIDVVPPSPDATEGQAAGAAATYSALPYALAVPADGTAAKTLQLADRTVGVISAAKINARPGEWTWTDGSGDPIDFTGDVPQPEWDVSEWYLDSSARNALSMALTGHPISYWDDVSAWSSDGENDMPIGFNVEFVMSVTATLKSFDYDTGSCVFTVNGVDVNGTVFRDPDASDSEAEFDFIIDRIEYYGNSLQSEFVVGAEFNVEGYREEYVTADQTPISQDYTAAVLPPPRADGKPRDFVVNLELETVDGDVAEFDFVPSTDETLSFVTKDGSFPAPQEGKNLYYFTEVEPHVLMVKAETVEVVGD